MNSVCIRRPAEFSGYSRLRSSASRSGRRQLLEDLFLVFLVEALEQFDGVVGFEFADALRDRLRLEFLEDFLADGIVDLVQRREVEIRARQFHQADAIVGLERRDQVAEIGLVQFGDECAQKRRVGGVNRACDFFDEFVANFAIFVAHRETVEHRTSADWATSISSAMPRLAGLTEWNNSSELSGHALPNRQHRAQ